MNPDTLVQKYFVQNQSQLFVTNRLWADLVSYVGTLPMVRVRVVPNPVFQEKLAVALRSFCAEFSDLVKRAVDLGYLKETGPTTDWIQAGDVEMVRRGKKPEPVGDFDLSDEDLSRIFEANERKDQPRPPA